MPALPRPLLLLAVLVGCDAPPAERPEITLSLSVHDDGTASDEWTTGIATQVDREAAEALAREHRPLTPEAAAWLDTLRAAIPMVADRAVELAAWFESEPLDATVVAGNRGSSDGFGWVPSHIGINLQAFSDSYGPPTEGARDRMARIVAHEYVHLLTYAHYPNHLELRDTPLNRALWTAFFEGLGDYVSMSNRWLPDERGKYSPVAARTLQRLEPQFVERLEGLVSAAPEEEDALRRGISMGK